jgi:Ulp1 family protease
MLSLTSKDFCRLRDNECLNDEVVNFYFNLMTELVAENVYVLHSYYYNKLEGSQTRNLTKWFKVSGQMITGLCPNHSTL